MTAPPREAPRGVGRPSLWAGSSLDHAGGSGLFTEMLPTLFIHVLIHSACVLGDRQYHKWKIPKLIRQKVMIASGR